MEKIIIPRPTIHDEEIVKKAAEKLANKVSEWLKDDLTVEEAIEDIYKAIRFNDDGYAIARNLETQGWSPDMELVEILDNASCYILNTLKKAEEIWVKESGLQPFPIESLVKWTRKPAYGVGIVISNHSDGKSTVMFESQGHVRQGTGTHGFVIEWEALVLTNNE